MKSQYDLVVIGGGIAGMTAAIYGARSNLSTLVIEQEVCGGLANWTHTVENFPSHQSIGGMDLMDSVKDQMLALGANLIEVVEIEGLELEGELKKISTDEGDFFARAVVLAMGRKPIMLPVDTDWDEHIHYCSLCDGNFYKDKDVVVVGGGNSAFDESLYLEGLGVKSITIVEAMENCPAAETTQQKALDTGKFTIMTGTKLTAIEPQGSSALVDLENVESGEKEQIKTDGMFVFIGQKPATDSLSEQIKTDKYGYIMVTEDMNTPIPGVFAAGDIISKRYRQLTTAMSDGTIAALEAHRYLCS
ncbi:NAD(P)/FAD-dependent oxidoreductase [Desulfopila sp. IMCC35008]|uniref:NAD(P)/FAD-dependent oxidoreductase n=1 Tax=Desulfopila sp. IMCC35008 TaxID=2653858 RepID=UPI0013D3D7D7|nr:NAD(P)/FAD-dependent oxidoreductase [Desulfopila sp. IMCC35008]